MEIPNDPDDEHEHESVAKLTRRNSLKKLGGMAKLDSGKTMTAQNDKV